MAWQERWAHPLAFGFRPAHSTADGAAVTQLLLELGRLKGWLVSGMGLDYRKRFDLMPQGIVFEVCKLLSWDAEVLAALQAMYCQLVRAFKLAGGLGDWWRATNGILQGCPLSFILVNARSETPGKGHGGGGGTAKTPEPLARVLLSRRVY